MRLSPQDMERLEELSKRLPTTSKTALAQKALQLGLEALERSLPPRTAAGTRPEANPGLQTGSEATPEANGPEAAPEANASRRANLQRLKTRLDRLETQVQEFFDSQASDTTRVRAKKKS
jgi:hypothetical protein